MDQVTLYYNNLNNISTKLDYRLMNNFTVNSVIDGDTFTVKGGWKWNDQTGEAIRPTGYDTQKKDNQDTMLQLKNYLI